MVKKNLLGLRPGPRIRDPSLDEHPRRFGPPAATHFVGAFFTTWLTIWPAICGYALGITTSLLS